MKKGGKIKQILLAIVVLAVISAALGSTGASKTDTVSGSDPTETGTQTTEAEPNAAISETEEPNTDVLDDNTVPAENEPADDTADTEPSLTMGQKMPQPKPSFI